MTQDQFDRIARQCMQPVGVAEDTVRRIHHQAFAAVADLPGDDPRTPKAVADALAQAYADA